MMKMLRLKLASLAIYLATPRAFTAKGNRHPINGPHQLAVDTAGNLYVSEEYGRSILRMGQPTSA